jgi:hypothetical protein
MTSLTGAGASTGSLDADVQFPNNCMLTRGQSTAVPVTITNNGSTTSAATTLSVRGDTGISGTASPSAVPAIAAGGTWSTTADLTVGASASLGDTIVALTLAGEGALPGVDLWRTSGLGQPGRRARRACAAGVGNRSLVSGRTKRPAQVRFAEPRGGHN